MNCRKIFKNSAGHYRAGWRIFFWLLITAISFVPIAALLKMVDILFPNVSSTTDVDNMNSVPIIIFYLGLFIAVITGSWITLKWVDKRPMSILGLNFNSKAIVYFAIGFSIGFTKILISFIALWVFGFIDVMCKCLLCFSF